MGERTWGREHVGVVEAEDIYYRLGDALAALKAGANEEPK